LGLGPTLGSISYERRQQLAQATATCQLPRRLLLDLQVTSRKVAPSGTSTDTVPETSTGTW